MDYSEKSVTELRNIAKERDLKGISALKKQEIIDLLTEDDNKKQAAQRTYSARSNEDVPQSSNEAQRTGGAAQDGRIRPDYAGGATKHPSVQQGQVRTDRQPAVQQGQVRTDRQPAAQQGQVRTDRQPAVQQGQVRTDRQSAVQQGQVRTDRQPAAQQGQVRTDRQPTAQQGQVRTDRQPTAQQGQVRTDRQPTVQQGQPWTNQQQAPRQASDASTGRIVQTSKITAGEREALDPSLSPEIESLDSGETKTGILELIPGENYGFLRCDNFLPGENDVYVSPAQIRKFNLKTGDIVVGNTKIRTAAEKFSALLYIKSVNGGHPNDAAKRPRFEDLTPIFPNYRLRLETPGCTPAMRIVDLLSPIGKGQRGMIVSQPKAGKTTLLKQIANALTKNYPELHLIILLIDERPEEVTDMKESIQGPNVEVIYSTFDETPDNHRRVSEMVIERARRLVEHKKDVVILLDSITRLARAYNLTVQASGRTLSGGLDPAALHMPKKFFGAARCMREGGSLTILATALVDTGSRMDDVVFEEFKGTGNMELVLDRNLSERRIFPAIDLPKSSTRREDLLLSAPEVEANNIIRRAFNSARSEETVEKILNLFARTKSNSEFIEIVKKTKL